MRQKSLHYLFLFIMLGIGFTGCKSDVDLSSVNVDSKVNARVAIPLGEITTTFKELIGLIPDTANIHFGENGEIDLFVKEHYTRQYHAIDLERYIGTTASDMLIMPLVNAPIIPQSTVDTVPFDMIVNFDGINDDTSDERLDSMVITQAKFTTKVTTLDFTIKDEDIEKVTMVLGSQFRRAKGKELELTNFHLGQDVPITVDDFTLIMMLDESQPPSIHNVVKNADIQFKMYLNTKNNIVVTATSAFHFDFRVEMMEYTALYGFFKAGNMAQDAGTVDIPLTIPGNEPMILPVKNPEIRMLFTYGLSMPLNVDVRELATVSSDGQKSPATWNGVPYTTIELKDVVPVSAPLTETVTDTILLDNSAEHGAIDKMFLNEVKKLAFDYSVYADTLREIRDANGNIVKDIYGNDSIMNQFRLTKETTFDLDMDVNVPMEFNKGLKIAYTDTIDSVNLSRASLDSLAAMAGDMLTIDSAKLYLVLTVTNEIPVSFEFDLTLLDDQEKAINLDSFKGIKLEGADIDASGKVTEVVTVNSILVKTEDFDELAKTRKIKIRARVGDDQKPSTFLTDKSLRIKINIAGDVQAGINMSLNTNK